MQLNVFDHRIAWEPDSLRGNGQSSIILRGQRDRADAVGGEIAQCAILLRNGQVADQANGASLGSEQLISLDQCGDRVLPAAVVFIAALAGQIYDVAGCVVVRLAGGINRQSRQCERRKHHDGYQKCNQFFHVISPFPF